MISALAAQQYGLVARWQLVAHGVQTDVIGRRVRAGRLVRIHDGVYAAGHATLTAEGKWLAAVLACGPGAVLSHRAAAALSRTLVDLADVVSERVLSRVLEQAEILRLDATPLPIPGRRGTGRLSRALAAHRPYVPLTRSELEKRMLELCRREGLPVPLVNTTVDGMEVDFCWPDQRVIAETDGWTYHGTRAAFSRDRRRSADLTAAGWTVVRFAEEDLVRDPDHVVATLRRVLL